MDSVWGLTSFSPVPDTRMRIPGNPWNKQISKGYLSVVSGRHTYGDT